MTSQASSAPSEERTARMERALSAALLVLGDANPTVSVSPLGPGWSSDLDIYVTDLQVAKQGAEAAGWLPLSSLLGHLGYAGTGSYGLVDGGRILAKVDLAVGQAPSSRDRSLARMRSMAVPDERAVREALLLTNDGLIELSELGPDLLASLAEAESVFGGSELAAYRTARSGAPTTGGEPHRTRVRRPQTRIAISGVDGSGKSTLTSGIQEALERSAIPWTLIWTRPGMRLVLLDRFAWWIKKLRNDTESGITRLGQGEPVNTIRSRSGVVGWVWLTMVTVAYLADIRGQTRRAQGVVIYDRHLLDALGTIEALYEGVPSQFQRWLVCRLIPSADFTVWLDIDPHEAAARKPDDLIGADLVAKQATAYRRHAQNLPGIRRHNGTGSSYLSAVQALAEFDGALGDHRPSWRARAFSMFRSR